MDQFRDPGMPISIASFQSLLCLVSSSSKYPRAFLESRFSANFSFLGKSKNFCDSDLNSSTRSKETPWLITWKNPHVEHACAIWAVTSDSGLERSMMGGSAPSSPTLLLALSKEGSVVVDIANLCTYLRKPQRRRVACSESVVSSARALQCYSSRVMGCEGRLIQSSSFDGVIIQKVLQKQGHRSMQIQHILRANPAP